MRFWVNTPFDTLPGEGCRPMRYWLLCRALAAAGHEVVLWSSDFHHVTKTRRPLEPVYVADGFQVRLIPTRPYRSNVSLRRVFSHHQYARRWSSLIGDAETRERLQTLSSDYDAAADRLEVSLSIGGKSRASAKSPAEEREAEREAEGEPVQHQQQHFQYHP